MLEFSMFYKVYAYSHSLKIQKFHATFTVVFLYSKTEIRTRLYCFKDVLVPIVQTETLKFIYKRTQETTTATELIKK